MDKYKVNDLKKLTVVKLRELAAEFEEIVGATGMNKEKLIEELSNALKKRDRFIVEEVHSKELEKLEADRLRLKPEMKTWIKQKKEILTQKDHDLAKLKEVRDKIKRLRRRIHRTHVREEQLKKILKLKS
ncbi:MAG: hypothetical protein JXQ27_00445 [Acidobacteria bacterium]|nr:hypothetical protein [Acidobacteriota bacterium]